ncbi:MAG: hypothetical protein ACI38Q_00285 [Candidatus Bruticola sp.]
MNKYCKYAFLLLCLVLADSQWAVAQNSDDELFVPPHPVDSIHEVVDNTSVLPENKRRLHSPDHEAASGLKEELNSEKLESDGFPLTAPTAHSTESDSDAEQNYPVQSEAAPVPAASIKKTEAVPLGGGAAIQRGSVDNRTAVVEKAAEADYQELFDVYYNLIQHKNGTSLDRSALNRLERLCSKEYDHDLFLKTYAAHIKSRAALVVSGHGSLADNLVKSAERDLTFVDDWLKIYGRRSTVHGVIEPDWLFGRTDVASQAILALCCLESYQPSADRRDKIEKLARGLVTCLRPDTKHYPYGSHLSYATENNRVRNYQVPQSDKKVAGITLYPERQYAAMALAKAYQLLKNDDFKASAEKEGLGLLAKLALSGKIPYCLAPRPEEELRSVFGATAVVENLLALKDCTGNNIYATLAGCAAVDINYFSDNATNAKAKSMINYLLSSYGCSEWIGAKDICRPFAGTTVELEAGKAVEKAFDTADIAYPGGTPGQFVVVGRDNMFWMRFDVERDDLYYFAMDFLKSNFSGALVSIMVRIDGDQIFRVNLGGATDDPFVDSAFINGPRQLRQGPHSVGVRFAGLLMKSPAILDSIVVDPAVGRRWIKMKDGKARLVMHSIADQSIKTRMQELEEKLAESPIWTMVEGTGVPSVKQLSSDRRGHVWLDMPAGGTAVLEWADGNIPNLVLDED